MTYGYDLLSRQAVVNQASGQAVSFAFDKAGRMSSTTAGSRTVSYLYDAAGNRTRVTWPDAFYVQYIYDSILAPDVSTIPWGVHVSARQHVSNEKNHGCRCGCGSAGRSVDGIPTGKNCDRSA